MAAQGCDVADQQRALTTLDDPEALQHRECAGDGLAMGIQAVGEVEMLG